MLTAIVGSGSLRCTDCHCASLAATCLQPLVAPSATRRRCGGGQVPATAAAAGAGKQRDTAPAGVKGGKNFCI